MKKIEMVINIIVVLYFLLALFYFYGIMVESIGKKEEKMDDKQLSQINKKLDILINVLLEKRQKEYKISDEGQALYLASFGLTPSEIAPLLAKSPNAIRIMLTRLRKKKKLK
jgi:hypothetical protein